MKTYIIRIIALLLVPCLVADTASAAIAAWPGTDSVSGMSLSKSTSHVYLQEAIIPPCELGAPRPITPSHNKWKLTRLIGRAFVAELNSIGNLVIGVAMLLLSSLLLLFGDFRHGFQLGISVALLWIVQVVVHEGLGQWAFRNWEPGQRFLAPFLSGAIGLILMFSSFPSGKLWGLLHFLGFAMCMCSGIDLVLICGTNLLKWHWAWTKKRLEENRSLAEAISRLVNFLTNNVQPEMAAGVPQRLKALHVRNIRSDDYLKLVLRSEDLPVVLRLYAYVLMSSTESVEPPVVLARSYLATVGSSAGFDELGEVYRAAVRLICEEDLKNLERNTIQIKLSEAA